MLPRIATPITVPIPSQEATNEVAPGGSRPALSAEALTNLRAALVLRLLEALMRQVGQNGDKGNVALQLLDVLFAAMKALPPRNGQDNEPARRLAALLSRLPAEMRPSIERLLTTAFSVASTRVLMETIRNPGGPDAQRLAQALLHAAAAEQHDGEQPAARGESQRFANLDARLAASARNVRQGLSPGAGATSPGNGGELQAALRRLFETGIDSRTAVARSPAPTQAPATPVAPAETSGHGADRGQNTGVPRSNESTRANSQAASSTAPGQLASGMDEGQSSHIEADNDDRPIGKSTGATENARDEAVKRANVPTQESVRQLIAGIVSNLTEDETLILRLLLGAPLPESSAPSGDQSLPPEPPADNSASGQPAEGADLSNDAAARSRAGLDPSSLEAAEGDTDASKAPVARQEDGGDEALKPENSDKAVRPAANAVPQPDRPAERLPIPVVIREGIGAPVVPYLPAQDDLDSLDAVQEEKAEDDEEGSDTDGENETDEGSGEGNDQDLPMEQEPVADPDLARRRSRIEAFVGPPDPGFTFYQKLGDYWT
ncbi:hypothetical protein IB238_16420 [Rhizobium sp. ARZ01]|uniref:hypothetical protein n=1 Tax=Rhizobium sp. ARZ01 TaxID=2769313 RepID=UPI00177C3710|nr:hypothetical protein [Rhizobium sp. ARZ01]MBD9374208.1 hypothetical protein [Rhizobium sp. ARZ01]